MALFGGGGFIALPTLVQRIAVDTSDVERAAKQIGGKFGAVLPEMAALGKNMTKFVTLPILGISAAAASAAIKFESSFAGVRKTVDATEAEFAALEKGFRNLALEIPVSVNELNRIGELGGQLGVAKSELIDFTRVVAQLSVTTNLTAEQAAEDLARFANIMQTPQSQFENIGSAVVDLGNKFAGTESEIIGFGLRIAGAGKIAGLTEGEILGIGTAMSSVGVEVERGGTAVQKVLIKMTSAVQAGGSELNTLAEVAGRSADEFAALFRENPAEAFIQFVEGLGRAGPRAFAILEELKLADQRLIASFLALAGAGKTLRTAIDAGNEGFERNIALAVEAEKRFATFESRLGLFRNRVNDALIDAGPAVLNALEPVLGLIEKLTAGFTSLPEGAQSAIVQIALVLATLGPGLILVSKFATSWATMKETLGKTELGTAALQMLGFRTAAEKASGSVTRLGGALRFLGRVGVLAALAGALELLQHINEVAREGRDLQAARFPDIVPDTESLKEQEKNLHELAETIRFTEEVKEKIGPPLVVEDFINLSNADKIEQLTVEMDRLVEAEKELGFLSKNIGGAFGIGRAGELDAQRRATQETLDALIKSRRVIEGLAQGNDLDEITHKAADWVPFFRRAGLSLEEARMSAAGMNTELVLSADEVDVLAANMGLVEEAMNNGADAASVVGALLAGDVDLAKRLALGLDAAAESGKTVVIPIEQLAEVFKIAEDELDAFNDRLKESADAIKATFEGITGTAALKDSAEIGLGDLISDDAVQKIEDAKDKVADIDDRLADLREKHRKAAAEDRAAIQRDIDKAERDLADAQSDLDAAQKSKTTKGFQALVRENIEFQKQFNKDLATIAEAGGTLLAQRLSEMGPEGAKIARDAAKQIAGGKGIGALEADMVEALLVAKKGMDDTFGLFKPNIEQVVGDNIAAPLVENLAVVKGHLSQGLDVSGEVDIMVAEFRRLAKLRGVDIAPIEGLLEFAATTDDAQAAVNALDLALQIVGAQNYQASLELDMSQFDAGAKRGVETLNKFGLLTATAELLADGSQASKEALKVIKELTGLTDEEWEAVVEAVSRGIPEVQAALDRAARDRHMTITADLVIANTQNTTPYNPDEFDDFELTFNHRGGLIRKFHGGGFAVLKGNEVPAILETGEFVINADSVRRIGLPVLEALNRMHGGGSVAVATAAPVGGASVVAPSLTLEFNGPIYGASAEDLARVLTPAILRRIESVWRQR